MWHFVYILQNQNQKQYIGSTKNLSNRLQKHNTKQVKATINGRPWHIVWYCAFRTKKEADNFEKYLKSGSGTTFRQRHLAPKNR